MATDNRQHCSSVPSILICAGSAQLVAEPYNPPSEVAGLGQAVHDALAGLVLNGPDKWIDLSRLAQANECDLADLERLFSYGRRAWAEISRYFPSPKVEHEMESPLFLGRTDLLHADGETMAVNDWKSGRVLRNHRGQLASYAHCAVDKYGWPKSGVVHALTTWLQFGFYEVQAFTPETLSDFEATYKKQLRNVGRQYAPGEACFFCKGQLVCAARQQFLHQSQTALAIVGQNPQALSVEKLASLYPASRALKKLLEQYDEACRMVLIKGPLPLADGYELRLVEINKQEFDPQKSWPVLKGAGFKDEDIARCITIGKGKMLEVVGDHAPDRGKGKAQRALLEQLEQAGAISTKALTRPEIARAK